MDRGHDRVADETDMAKRERSSSLMIVPMACDRERVALTGPERFTNKLSLVSTFVSPFTITVMTLFVWGYVKVRVPLVAI